jgi:hypothetical protein
MSLTIRHRDVGNIESKSVSCCLLDVILGAPKISNASDEWMTATTEISQNATAYSLFSCHK